MLKRTQVSFILFLCIISLIGIGFSSWAIALPPSTTQKEGIIQTETIINSADYVYLDTSKGDDLSGIKCFKYTKTGFLNSDNIVSSSGQIEVYFRIDIAKCYELFASEFNSLKITFTLKYENNVLTDLNIFQNDIQEDGKRELDYQVLLDSKYSYTAGDIYGIENKQYSLPLSLNNILSDYTTGVDEDIVNLTMQYNFFATTGNYFNNNIYNYLYQNEIKFAVNVTITGINV